MLALNSHAGQESGEDKMKMGDMNMSSMNMDSSGMNANKSMAMNEGEVKAVDKAKKSFTLKHGHLKSKTVEMGPMTMSFPDQKKSLQSNVNVGSIVKFTIELIEKVII